LPNLEPPTVLTSTPPRRSCFPPAIGRNRCTRKLSLKPSEETFGVRALMSLHIPFYRSEDRGAGVSSGVKSSSINTINYKDGLAVLLK
jgi:hypothetical protein